MKFTSAAIQVLALTISTSSAADSDNFSAYETKFMKAFDWCTGTGGDETDPPIHWIDKNVDVWHAKVKDGSRYEPERNDEGKIDDLNKFVTDRLETLPTDVAKEGLPALIIENHCASVETPTDDCIFDFAGTPAPEQWALQDGIEGIHPSLYGNVPAEITQYERKKEMTVVYVPASDSPDNAKEITKNEPDDKPKLADLKVRGNSSRKIPKKQLQLKLPKGHAYALIPGGVEARKWVISAYPSDPSYVENAAVFESYQRIGNLQRQHSPGWPTDGSVEDRAAQAWSPSAKPVNLILQGRYVGVYNIVDKVDLDNRVWIPEEEEEELNNNNSDESDPEESTTTTTTPTKRVIDDMKVPSGSYFLGLDWTERSKKEINPDRVISGEEDEFYTPNHQGEHQSNAWTIDGPDDKTFADYETDEDIALLRSFLLKLDELLHDPKGNDEVLSQVIDMRSMARFFLMAEIAREADEYGGSMYFKYVGGKLYHAAPWDYAGTSYPTEVCGTPFSRYSGVVFDWETDTFADNERCDESTGNMHTAGWHVDSLFTFDVGAVCGASPEDCNKGKPVLANLRWFFSKLFHTPSLQSEFWALWDVVVEHGLVEDSAPTDSGDIFSLDKLIDELFEPQKVATAVDRKIWYAQMSVINDIANANEQGIVPLIDTEVCTPILHDSLRVSANGDDSTEPYLIPAKDWMFHTAAESGNFVTFYENVNADLSYFTQYLDNDALIVAKKQFIKHRLDWIAAQRPSTTSSSSGNMSNEGENTTASTEPILVEQDTVVGLRGA